MEQQQKIPLSCDRRNFTRCDRCVLNLLRPHLMQAEENNHRFSKIQTLLRHFKEALAQESVISLARDGQVRFMTQRAEHLLDKYFCRYRLQNMN